jgi:hypothetical protein
MLTLVCPASFRSLSGNQLTVLDVSKNIALTKLYELNLALLALLATPAFSAPHLHIAPFF